MSLVKEYSVQYGSERIYFALRFQPTRLPNKVAIHVEPDGRVLVDAPEGTSIESAKMAVKQRARWISKQLAPIHTRRAHVLPREYVSGEAVHYLGRRYRLKVIRADEDNPSVRLKGGYVEISLRSPTAEAVKAALLGWLSQRARSVFAERLSAVSAQLRWVATPPPVRIRTMRRQWGSCSPKGLLTLNMHLVKASRECIDYVLLHELCHLKEHNHGPRFYRLLARELPGWEQVKTRLDERAEEVLVC